MNKEVKIIGLSVNSNVGIIKAHRLTFDKNNNLIVFKGGVGDGKSTEQRILQLGTQGSKTLTDKELYGKIDIETQLLDGDMPVFVGCKSYGKGLTYTLYTKNKEGKIIKEPIIDGVKATPAKYLDTLQTELTWRMDELTSENQSVQKKILLQLYKFELVKHGVIIDKKAEGYGKSILGRIEKAEDVRGEKDSLRKMCGGIADDLKAKGYDVERPATIPDDVDILALEADIKAIEKKITIKETEANGTKESKLQKLALEGQGIVNDAHTRNASRTEQLTNHKKEVEKFNTDQVTKTHNINDAKDAHYKLIELGYSGKEVDAWIKTLPQPEDQKETKFIELITFKDDGKIDCTIEYVDPKNLEIKTKMLALGKQYIDTDAEVIEVDFSELEKEKEGINNKITLGKEVNLIVKAVDSWHEWSKSDGDVVKLKKEYSDLLLKVDTGVDGLVISPNDSGDLFLMYNGAYDPAYFGNDKKQFRKVSGYSGTQKPVICLLIQNFLLSRKPKALRYMYIDNVPIDNKTRVLLEDICIKLDLRIFLNITGDFEKKSLKDGEILIEGGEVFFNGIEDVAEVLPVAEVETEPEPETPKKEDDPLKDLPF